MLIAEQDELPVCLDNNSDAQSSETASKVGVIQVRSPDDTIRCSVTSPGKVLLSTVQAPAPHQGLSLCAGSLCAERLGGISPQPMQANVSPSSYQQKTDSSSVSWDPAVFRPALVSCYSGEIFSGVNTLPDVSIVPGIGFQKSDCGSWVRKLKSGEDFKDVFHNCGRLGCPVCMPGELTDKGRDVETRFKLYEDAKSAENAVLIPGERRNIDPRHIVFSMSPDHTAELIAKVRVSLPGPWGPKHAGAFMDIYREEEDLAIKISGLIAGLKVYHEARVQHPFTKSTGARAKHLIGMEAKIAGDMKDEDASWKLYDHIRQQKNWMQYYYLSPHTHVAGHGLLIDAEEFERLMPGWKYHNKGYAKNPGGLARYLMSHMAMVEGHKSVSWFGRMSSASLGKIALGAAYQQVQVHPVTKIPWIIWESIEPDEIGMTWSIEVTDYIGFFRLKKKRGPPKIKFPKSETSRPRAVEMSAYQRERGILAMSRFVDEYGRL